MKGLTLNLASILGVFVPLSFYCCLSGTLFTLFILPFSLKHDNMKSAVKKLATIFLLIWLLNIFANFFLLFTGSASLTYNSKIEYCLMENKKML